MSRLSCWMLYGLLHASLYSRPLDELQPSGALLVNLRQRATACISPARRLRIFGAGQWTRHSQAETARELRAAHAARLPVRASALGVLLGRRLVGASSGLLEALEWASCDGWQSHRGGASRSRLSDFPDGHRETSSCPRPHPTISGPCFVRTTMHSCRSHKLATGLDHIPHNRPWRGGGRSEPNARFAQQFGFCCLLLRTVHASHGWSCT